LAKEATPPVSRLKWAFGGAGCAGVLQAPELLQAADLLQQQGQARDLCGAAADAGDVAAFPETGMGGGAVFEGILVARLSAAGLGRGLGSLRLAEAGTQRECLSRT
jgi:hypothetical protein